MVVDGRRSIVHSCGMPERRMEEQRYRYADCWELSNTVKLSVFVAMVMNLG